MRRLLLTTILAMPFASAAAFAADLPSASPPPAPAPYYAPPVFTWTGFYIGVNGGYGGGQYSYPFAYTDGDDALTGSATLTSSGFLGGGQIGYNWQAGALVVGAEADIDAAQIRGNVGLNATGTGGLAGAISAGSDVSWFGTVRARLGWLATDRFLVYATGGYAYGNVSSNYSYSLTDGGSISGSGSTERTASGWTVGGGAEYAITNNWTFKAEYLYVNLGRSPLLDATDVIDEGDTLDISSKTSFNLVRVGLNYKF